MEENQLQTPSQPLAPLVNPTEIKIGSLYTSIPNDKVLPAFQKALNEIDSASKDANNPHFGKKYADLADCMKVIKPALGNNGLSLSQPPTLAPDMKSVTIENIIIHSSGQYIRWTFTMPIEGQIKAHEVGKTVTYARRYSLPGLGIIAEDDDDGNTASNVGGQQRQQAQQQRREPPPPPQPAKAAAKPKQEAAKPVEEKPQPKPEPQTELGAYLNGDDGGDDELQKIITSITQKHTGVTPAAIDRFMETTQIKKQPMELQVAFMQKYSENRDFSMVATQWTRTGKSFQECFDEAVAKGPTVWRDSIQSA